MVHRSENVEVLVYSLQPAVYNKIYFIELDYKTS